MKRKAIFIKLMNGQNIVAIDDGFKKDEFGGFAIDPAKAVMALVAERGGQVGLQYVKLKEDIHQPTWMHVPVSSMMFYADCGNEKMITDISATLAGLVLAGPALLDTNRKLQ